MIGVALCGLCVVKFKSLCFVLKRDCDAVDDAVRLIKISSCFPVFVRRLAAFIVKPLVSSGYVYRFSLLMQLSLAATSLLGFMKPIQQNSLMYFTCPTTWGHIQDL